MFRAFKNIWFCGLAASGKTTVLRKMKDDFPHANFLNDSLEIIQFVEKDTQQKHHKKPTPDTFVLTDSAATKHAVDSLIQKVSDSESECVIELSRGNDVKGVVDFSYEYLFSQLPTELKKNSLFVYIHAPVEERKKRNQQRPKLSKNATVFESFFCPEEAFDRFFINDDFLQAIEKTPVNHLYLPNIYDLNYFKTMITNLFQAE